MRKWVYLARSFAASSGVIVIVGAGLTGGAGSFGDTRSTGNMGSTGCTVMAGRGGAGAGVSTDGGKETSGATAMIGGEGAAEGAATEGVGLFERLWGVLRVRDPILKTFFSRLANLDSLAVWVRSSAISIIDVGRRQQLEGYIIMS